jgi:hypothetical protein
VIKPGSGSGLLKISYEQAVITISEFMRRAGRLAEALGMWKTFWWEDRYNVKIFSAFW